MRMRKGANLEVFSVARAAERLCRPHDAQDMQSAEPRAVRPRPDVADWAAAPPDDDECGAAVDDALPGGNGHAAEAAPDARYPR